MLIRAEHFRERRNHDDAAANAEQTAEEAGAQTDQNEFRDLNKSSAPFLDYSTNMASP